MIIVNTFSLWGEGMRYGFDTMLNKYQGGGPLFLLVPVSTTVLTGNDEGGSL